MELVQLYLDICEEQKDTSFHANLSPLFHLHPALLNFISLPFKFFVSLCRDRESKGE
jgi:hypothetical protein